MKFIITCGFYKATVSADGYNIERFCFGLSVHALQGWADLGQACRLEGAHFQVSCLENTPTLLQALVDRTVPQAENKKEPSKKETTVSRKDDDDGAQGLKSSLMNDDNIFHCLYSPVCCQCEWHLSRLICKVPPGQAGRNCVSIKSRVILHRQCGIFKRIRERARSSGCISV